MQVPTVGRSLFRKTFLGLVCALYKRPGGLRRVALHGFLSFSCCPINRIQCNKYQWYGALYWIQWEIETGVEQTPCPQRAFNLD